MLGELRVDLHGPPVEEEVHVRNVKIRARFVLVGLNENDVRVSTPQEHGDVVGRKTGEYISSEPRFSEEFPYDRVADN